MKEISRREALNALAAGGAGLALGSLVEAKAANADAQAATPLAFRGQHEPRPLPFNPARLKGISENLIRSHWENNYGGSVRALNAVEKRLDAMLKDKDIPAYVYGDLKREELLRTGSVVLHEQYFGNLGGGGKAGGEVLHAVKQWFGSYEQWEAEFKRTANALSGGSGWAILTYSLHNGEIHNYWAWDHMHNAPAGQPLLVLDMYEHSYQMDYGAAAAKYIDAFMDNVNWEEVDRRLVRAQKASAALRT
ncbi:MAG TPA: Fe-Mn family superoxide dismutase [Pyrinomonadaceae bacterium]|jgi:Fe-Mn family superoxide dismutase